MPTDLWGWLTFDDPSAGVPARLVGHLQYTAGGVLLACLVGLPLGLLLGHWGRGGTVAINLSNTGRAIPTLGVVVLFAVSPLGTSLLSLSLALGLFALPPVLTNAYVGMREVDREAVEAARGMGMNGWQVWWRVELPLALPIILAGLRIAAVVAIGIATFGAKFNAGGLGRLLFDGVARGRADLIWAGALAVGLLAFAVNGALLLLERALDPRTRIRRAGRRAAALPRPVESAQPLQG